MVDVDRVGLQNLLKLVDKCRSGCFYTQNVEDFSDVVGVRSVGIDFGMRKDLAQVGALSLKDYELVLVLLFLAELVAVVAVEDHSP